MTSQLKICLVIPCYNEASRLETSKYQQFMNENPHIGLCFVNDGSLDGTLKMLKDMTESSPQAVVLDLARNGGKAEAVRQGVLSQVNKDWDYVGFWDADLATPLEEIPNFISILQKKQHDCVMGSRVLRLGGKIHRKWQRHILGRLFATVASLCLRLPVYDTQCGSKFYRAEYIEQLFGESFLSHWLFDVELLFRLKQNKRQLPPEDLIYELPLGSWKDVHGSRLKLKDFLIAPWELWKISRRYGH